MPWWGSLGSYRYPWLIAWLVPTWSVVWSCALCGFAVLVVSWVGRGIGETLARMTSQTRISSRYRMHCSLGLRFSCRAWKSCMGSPLPRLAMGRGRGGVAALLLRLVCWTGWVAARWLTEGTVNLLMSPTVLAWSGRCDLTCSVVMWAGVVVLFAIPAMTYCSWGVSEWVSSFLTAHQHKIGHSVPYVVKIS